MGGRFIRILGGAAYPESLNDVDTSIYNMCECFEQCIHIAERYGIRIVFENDSQPPTWSSLKFCFDLERFIRTWSRLKELPIGFNFDTGDAFFLEKWQIILNAVLDRLESLNITDYDYKDGKLNMTVFGEGTVPIKKMLEIIKESGFNGTISMEDTTFQGLKGTTESYKYVKKYVKKYFINKKEVVNERITNLY